MRQLILFLIGWVIGLGGASLLLPDDADAHGKHTTNPPHQLCSQVGRPGSTIRKECVIRQVFGPYGWQAIRVARCESGPSISTTARNGQYRGAFQMGSRERRTYGHGRTILAQARAAHRYFIAAGGWGPWTCRP